VYAFFESGDLVARTHDGTERWRRSLSTQVGEFKNNHGLGSRPAQTDRAVLVLVDHQGPSYLPAVNKADGKDLWKADRPARSSWPSPVVTSVGGGPVAIVSSGGAVTGNDTRSGKQPLELDGLDGTFVVRTGTGLGCVRNTTPAKCP
jgi:outer membrane protein assembly factor BamB